jgi:CBS domain-containing protein
MHVKDVMRAEVKSIPVGTSVKDAFTLMRQGGFRHLPVLDSQGAVVGIVSDRDLRNVVVLYKDPASGAEDFFVTDDVVVDKVMSADPVSVSPDDDVSTAVRLIREQHLGCLIVSENGRLAGILSYIDLLDVLLDLLEGRS